MSDEPSWIVLMTERYPEGDGPARVYVLAHYWDARGNECRDVTDRLRLATRYSREDAEAEAAKGYPGYCCTAVPTGPGVPGLAWEETR